MKQFFAFLVLLCSFNSVVYALSAMDVMSKAYGLDRGQDSISTLTFYRQEPGKSETKQSFVMLWKQYDKSSKYSDKYLLFQEYPFSEKGFSYMGWQYKFELQKGGESWAYIPKLRSIRQLTQNMKEQQKAMLDQSIHFPQFWLTRSASMDEHTFLDVENNKNREYYIVESHPKYDNLLYPFSKTVHWIQKDSFLPVKVEFYDDKNEVELSQSLQWDNINSAWVWKKIKTFRPKTGIKVILDVTDIKINTGLKDRDFTKRMMKSGSGRFKR